MKGKRNPFVAREGIPLLAVAAAATGLTAAYVGMTEALVPAAFFVWFFLVFRDPKRSIPAVPLGVVSPVDGRVVEAGPGPGIVDEAALRIVIRIDSLGTYTARCPTEGKIMNLRGEDLDRPLGQRETGLWVRTDENDDVVLKFHGYRFGMPPRAFLGYGERVGQGQRCAYLRLARFAEVQIPGNGRVQVEAGQRVTAGSDLIGRLPHP